VINGPKGVLLYCHLSGDAVYPLLLALPVPLLGSFVGWVVVDSAVDAGFLCLRPLNDLL
jgi:hypothetical protein